MLRYCFLLLVYFSMNLPAAAFRDVDVHSVGTRRHLLYVQVAARNDEHATSLYAALVKERYGRILGEHAISIRKAEPREVDGKMNVWRSRDDVQRWWYRVLIGPMEPREADLLCERLKEAGMKGCFVRENEQ
jgi:sporulation related protein